MKQHVFTVVFRLHEELFTTVLLQLKGGTLKKIAVEIYILPNALLSNLEVSTHHPRCLSYIKAIDIDHMH